MHDCELVGVVCNYPVETPFEHRERLIEWQWFERSLSVKVKTDLRSGPAPEKAGRRQFNSEIDELPDWTKREICIHVGDTANDLLEARLERYVENTDSDVQPVTSKLAGNLGGA